MAILCPPARKLTGYSGFLSAFHAVYDTTLLFLLSATVGTPLAVASRGDEMITPRCHL